MNRSTRVASAGEALVDLFPRVDDGDVQNVQVVPGGSSLNVAIAMARLGLRVSFAGRLSTDAFGKSLIRTLDREGVDTAYVQVGSEPTALAIVGREGDDVTYDFRWSGTADRAYDPLASGTFDEFDALHVGSVAVGIDPMGGRLLELMEAVHGRVFLTFDPNVRRDVVDDWPTYVERVQRAAELADLVKVSDVDLVALEASVSPDGAPFGRIGPTIVTAGPRGATLIRAGHDQLEIPALHIDVMDTVGAGDASMAALISALAERDLLSPGAVDDLPDETWSDLLRVMMTAAAMTCERTGADPPTAMALRARLDA